jgi:hypothetical protein
MNEPIISFTTIPSRIYLIESCVKNLLAQGYSVHAWLPLRCKRTGEYMPDLPDFMMRGLTVHFVNDVGPGTKLIPALLAGYETVITADDDRIYGEGWAKGLVSAANKYPKSVIAYRGRMMDSTTEYQKCRIVQNVERDTEVSIVTGCSGALYRRKFFDEKYIKKYSGSINDDIQFSHHFLNRGIKIIVPSVSGVSINKTSVRRVQPLTSINIRKGANNKLMKDLFAGGAKTK